MKGRIFISYRRDDARGDARSIHDRLVRKFGDANVFMDVDSLMAGQRFDRQLDEALARCDVLLAVIGPRWMDALAEKAKGGERDFVRDEIAAALKRDIAVIPVLTGQEERMPQMPRGADLPEDIHDLALYQKHSITHESFSRNIDDLIEAIEKVRRAKGKPRSVTPLIAAAAVALVALVAALVVFRGDIAGWFAVRPPGEAPVQEAKTLPTPEPKTVELSPAQIAERYGKSVIAIRFRWRVYDGQQPVYHKTWLDTDGSGNLLRLPAYFRDGERLVPWLTTENEGRQNLALQGSGAGTGFVVSSDGLILTTRTIGSAWMDGISLSTYFTGGTVFVFSKAENGFKPRPVAADTIDQTIWAPDSRETRIFSVGGEPQLSAGFPRTLLGRNDDLVMRFASGNTDVKGEVLRVARDQNVALLKVAASNLTPAVLADNEITAGTRVVALSYSDGSNAAPTLADGIVRSAPIDDADPRRRNIQTSIQVGLGTSGAPVFNPDGKVAGIINFFTRDGGQVTTYALPIKHGRNLLQPQVTR